MSKVSFMRIVIELSTLVNGNTSRLFLYFINMLLRLRIARTKKFIAEYIH